MLRGEGGGGLSALRLGGNRIGVAGAAAIARALGANRSLGTLSVADNLTPTLTPTSTLTPIPTPTPTLTPTLTLTLALTLTRHTLPG
jgi:hypothetical protein